MSTIGSVGTGYGFLNSLIANAASVHQQLNTLAEQASTLTVSFSYSLTACDVGASSTDTWAAS
jgi:hypothetical protein